MSFTKVYRSRWLIAVSVVAIALMLSLTPLLGARTRAAGNANSQSFTFVFRGHSATLLQPSATPPTDAFCRKNFGFPCYSPQEIRRAYGVTSLINAGFTGAGQSIVIIDSFGSPTIAQDLHTFDVGYGLPDPPSLKVLAPLGKIKFDPHNSDMVGWAFETTLDVEWSHAIAPGANIVLMTSPVSETEGVQGFPEFLFLEQFALKHHLGKIISQSFGATENTLFNPGGRQVLRQFNDFYKQAASENVTVFASSGDSGAANVNINGKFFPFRTVIFPASSPFVTAVGGTSLFASTQGVYQSEVVWNGGQPNGGATGGGVSQVFTEPDFQHANLPKSDQKLLNGFRGIPDIAYNADPATSILVFGSFLGPKNTGFFAIGGTSEGSPQWAGLIADGNQLAGRPLGYINPALYQLGSGSDAAESFHDITVGNNTQAGVTGFNATPGWDLTTGWGTPKAATMLEELIEITGGTAS